MQPNASPPRIDRERLELDDPVRHGATRCIRNSPCLIKAFNPAKEEPMARTTPAMSRQCAKVTTPYVKPGEGMKFYGNKDDAAVIIAVH
ncbi:hypothetical protein KHC17_28255 (plasmid) [Agrobacterium salinitolerans]|uniref:hypothetical protein n=1 Tax=Agrobacterium salinitolerans TaxID=1183413 RepID=UPI001C247479|nr:hypothetical protein [Agrobacterium salinitolerans]QXC53000.1 hypothetical protein KHC17_28255 [Agrobacterium salinitolerans]